MSVDTAPTVVPRHAPAAFFKERRRAERHEPVEDHFWLGWWASPSEFRVQAARLINISRTGLALEVLEAPSPGQTVWARIEGPLSSGCVEGRVVGCDDCDGIATRARVEFTSHCPDGLFRIAVAGRPDAPPIQSTA